MRPSLMVYKVPPCNKIGPCCGAPGLILCAVAGKAVAAITVAASKDNACFISAALQGYSATAVETATCVLAKRRIHYRNARLAEVRGKRAGFLVAPGRPPLAPSAPVVDAQLRCPYDAQDPQHDQST